MITAEQIVATIRRAGRAELGDNFLKGCLVLSTVVARLFAELRGEQLRLATDWKHGWCEDSTGRVYDAQADPPLAGAVAPAGYRAARLDEDTASLYADLARSFGELHQVPHFANANAVALNIRLAALVEIARQADGETLERLIFNLGRDGLWAVQVARPELVEGWRAAARRARALEAAGLDEGRPFNEIGLGDGGWR